VYRRRRIVVLLAIVAVVALVWLLIAQPWRGAAAQDAAAKPSPSVSSSSLPSSPPTETPVPDEGTPTETPAPVETPEAPDPSASASTTPTAAPCVARNVDVQAVSDQDTYEPGQNPQLSIQLTNSGNSACTLNVGTSGQSFTITSGTDVWWRSTDCQTEPSDMVVLLAAGQSVSSAAPLTWDRTRSSVGSCADANRQSAPGGGASYHLSVEIGGIASTQSKQMLLY
jgi:cytoskeletal protein RodZ